MDSRFILVIVALGLTVGLVFGAIGVAVMAPPPVSVRAAAVELNQADQDDFIIMVAESYFSDRQLALARDRLARLGDKQIASRVERLAISYAPQRDLVARYLALLAVSLGSSSPSLLALNAPEASAPLEPGATAAPTVLPEATDTTLMALAHNMADSLAQPPPTLTFTPTPLPTNTLAPTSTRLPPTPVPTKPPTAAPVAAPAAAPPPSVEFLPDRSRWPGGVYYEPAKVAPGQGYWRLVKAIYCDAFDPSDPHKHDFGCDQMPGGPAGTSIYVMTGGAPIDAIRPDGVNVGDNRGIIGDKKAPNDMCNCTFAFLASNYRISVRGAPSDAIGGFGLASVNFGWGSHAHVRYFLYFQYVTR